MPSNDLSWSFNIHAMQISSEILAAVQSYLNGEPFEETLRVDSDTEIQKLSINESEGKVVITIKIRLKNGN
jgi:hypothetical protein